ncbi:MAG: PIN domain-containing protein [Candidatus Aenigmarchaeota archaeon]|nr:PIN domain-containing protein [Candidatus Aenigmarchaeota archaeon]
MSQVLIDSSVWIAYFYGPQIEAKNVIDSDNAIFLSVISLFEIRRKLLRRVVQRQQIEKVLSFIRSRGIVIDINRVIAEAAAEISFKHNLSTADALIYATAAERKLELITGDSDFAKLNNVRILK